MNGLANTESFSVNPESLKNCFQVLSMKQQQNQQILSEAQNYVQECKKDQQFPVILLGMFDNQAEVLSFVIRAPNNFE